MTLREKALRAKLNAARAELKIRERTFNAAQRGLDKTRLTITGLETRIASIELAQS